MMTLLTGAKWRADDSLLTQRQSADTLGLLIFAIAIRAISRRRIRKPGSFSARSYSSAWSCFPLMWCASTFAFL